MRQLSEQLAFEESPAATEQPLDAQDEDQPQADRASLGGQEEEAKGAGGSAISASESMFSADFRLGKFSLTLLYDHVERNGIQILVREFEISAKKYPGGAKFPFAHELYARNELFGIYSVDPTKDRVAILEQISAPSGPTESLGEEETKEGTFEDADTVSRQQVL